MKNPPFVIKDATTFYASIKSNPLYDSLEDNNIIQILEDEAHARFSIAEGFGREKRDNYLFWQGAHLGTLLMAKILKHHIVTEAQAGNIDPETGKSYADQDTH